MFVGERFLLTEDAYKCSMKLDTTLVGFSGVTKYMKIEVEVLAERRCFEADRLNYSAYV